MVLIPFHYRSSFEDPEWILIELQGNIELNPSNLYMLEGNNKNEIVKDQLKISLELSNSIDFAEIKNSSSLSKVK